MTNVHAGRKTLIGVAFVLGSLLLAVPAGALPRYGPLEVSGNISAQQLIRFNPDIDKLALVQQRNTFKLRVDYLLLSRGKLIDKYNVPLVSRAKLFALYRGVYDSVYDYTPGFEQRDIYGLPIGLRLDSFSGEERDEIKFENRLREAYVDVWLKNLPLSLRVGRQQIVWGETDNFRMLDRVNPLDLTWHLQQESWDELRIPLWMIKGLVDLDRVFTGSPLSNQFVEFYWNPGDWYPAKREFLPNPWSAPIKSPIDELIKDLGIVGQKVNRLYHNTVLFHQGDYKRNPADNSQFGIRFSAVTPQGLQFTLDYFYQRWAGDDGTNAASFSAVLNRAQATAALKRGEIPLEAIAPYVHTMGFSLNYAEDTYTQTVYRMESIYEMGVPFLDASKPSPIGLLAQDVLGVSRRDMWKGMLAFDRPTWIRLVNRKATVLLLGQFFWHYLVNNSNSFRGQFSAVSGLTSGGTSYIDKVRTWESLITLAGTTFYRGGKIVPFVVYVLDPVNSYNQEVIWMLDYFVTNNVILNLSQRYFINTTSRPVFESWGVAGINRGRSETGIRLTYQF